MTDKTDKNLGEELPAGLISEVEKTIDEGKNVAIEEPGTIPAKKDPFEGKQLQFPCDYQISVMGINCDEYKEAVLGIIKQYVPELQEADLSSAFSSGDKYCSLRARFTAKDQQQLDALYSALSANKLVKWVL